MDGNQEENNMQVFTSFYYFSCPHFGFVQSKMDFQWSHTILFAPGFGSVRSSLFLFGMLWMGLI
jgi:hypothetical protein